MQSYRWHPALTASLCGPMVGNMPLHLQQSDLDGACGAHCALMALMAFGFVHRQDINRLPRSRNKRLTAVWQRTERHFFSGMLPKQLQAVLAPYAKDLVCAVERLDCVPRLLTGLHKSGLGIINIHNDEINHWVLAVGSGGTQTDTAYQSLSLLIIDPSHGTIPLTPWNALLSIDADRQHRHTYDTPDERLRVHIDCAVALRRIDHGTA